MTDATTLSQLGLISDRALNSQEQDRFAHDDFVDQLEALVRSGVDTANIALFGSWGAGKSSIASRLHARFSSKFDRDRIRFVEFNAFKYAKTPLLRNFIFRIAEETVPKRAAHYKRELYARVVKSTITIPEGWHKAVWMCLWTIAIVVVADLVLLVSLSGTAHEVALDVMRGVLPTALPISVLVIVAAKVLPFFTADTETIAPSSDEQFEELFRKLVRDDLKVDGKGDRRLVVFIDELDRCSPSEVAETLETLRTFVNIPGCIFIVAADQHVLEHALTRRVRQSTPPDTTNPYYSAGSGYLDKIFEYQIGLPTLLPSRLVDFAALSIADAGGVWKELKNLDAVLSVLIPVHVQSPRRVKVLLNRFAMAYAVAERRAKANKLQANLSDRAPELAKLVCLRTEFPLFARDLERDSRLAELILCYRDCMDAGEDTADNPQIAAADPETRRLARMHASYQRPVAELLADGDDDANEPRDNELGDCDDEGEDKSVLSSEEFTVRRAHARQLFDYLQKTRSIEGPRQDLIHLESGGAVFGIDPALAQELEAAALNNQPSRVIEAIDRRDADDQVKSLLVLGALLRRSRGNDADNVMRSLLSACEATGAALDAVAPQLVPFLEDHHRREPIAADQLGGALQLAVLGGSAELIDDVLARDEILADQLLRERVLGLAVRLPAKYDERLGQVAARDAVRDGAHLAKILDTLPDDDVELIVRQAIPWIKGSIKAVTDLAADDAAMDEAGAEKLADAASSIQAMVSQLVDSEHTKSAELVLLALLESDREEIHQLQSELQSTLKPIMSREVVSALLIDLPRWPVTAWKPLLASLDPGVASVATTDEAQDAITAKWWELWVGRGDDPANLHDGLTAVIETLSLNSPTEAPITAQEVTETLAKPVTAADVAEYERLLEGASSLAACGALTKAVPADRAMAAISEVAASALPPTMAVAEATELIVKLAERWANDASVGELKATATVATDSPWLVSPYVETLALLVDAALPASEQTGSVSAENLAALLNEHGLESHRAVRIWLTGRNPTPDEVLTVLEPWITKAPPTDIRDALRRYAEGLSRDAVNDLATRLTRAGLERPPTREFLTATRFSEADDLLVAGELVALAAKASNAAGREVVLELWETLAPRDSAARRKLIIEVLIPMLRKGSSTYDLVRRRLKLAADPPHGSKATLVGELVAAAPDEKRGRQMQDRMADLGLAPRQRRKRLGIF